MKEGKKLEGTVSFAQQNTNRWKAYSENKQLKEHEVEKMAENIQEKSGEWQKVRDRNIHNFEEQKEIVGVFVRTLENPQFGGSDYLIKTKEKGDITVFGKVALRTKMHQVKEGSVVKIVYKGKRKSAGGMTYEDYDVFINKNA